jgi:hypothetical protein
MDAQHFFPYHEPSLVQTLVLSSFFVFLNAARALGDRLANVGILGESLQAACRAAAGSEPHKAKPC